MRIFDTSLREIGHMCAFSGLVFTENKLSKGHGFGESDAGNCGPIRDGSGSIWANVGGGEGSFASHHK